MFLSVLLVGLTSFLFYKWIKRRRYYHLLSLIPSPPKSRIPFVGHLYLMTDELKKLKPGSKAGEAFFNFERKMSKNYESQGIVYVDFELTNGSWVYILKPSMYREILTDVDNLTKPKYYYLVSDFLGVDNLLFSYGKSWKFARKMITPAFHYTTLERFSSSFNSCADDLCERLRSMKTVPDLYAIMSHYLMKSLMVTSLGVQVTEENENAVDDYLKYFEGYNECYSERATNPLFVYDWIFSLTPIGRRRTVALQRLHSFTSDAIRSRMEYLKNSDNVVEKRKCCLADTLIREHLNNPTQFTMEYIRSQLDTFTFAGHDTTSSTLTNTLFLVAINPQIQQRLHEEIDENLSNEEKKHVTTECLTKLKYLDAVLKESQRFYPAVSSFGRQVTKEITIAGYTLPAGCTIMFNLFALNRDPDQYSNPEVFNPDRFLPDNEENINRHPFAFIPFSAGLRNCIGQKFAVNELKIFLIKILSNFNISTTLTEKDITFCQGLTLSMSNKIEMKFEPR